jgi:hypothetical protein
MGDGNKTCNEDKRTLSLTRLRLHQHLTHNSSLKLVERYLQEQLARAFLTTAA